MQYAHHIIYAHLCFGFLSFYVEKGEDKNDPDDAAVKLLQTQRRAEISFYYVSPHCH